MQMAEDTLVVFTSDHGELLGDHGLIRKGPSPYRALLNVPLVVAGPGVVPGMRDGLTSHVDLRATLNAQLELPTQPTDGHSFAKLLADPVAQGPASIIAEYHPRTRAETYNQTLLTRDWRLTIYPLNPGWGEMFDLANDPGEHRNLYFDAAFAATRQALTARLSAELPPAPDAGGRSIATY